MSAECEISKGKVLPVIDQLFNLLAEEFVLCTKTRLATWNVNGQDMQKNKIFLESQYEQLEHIVSTIADRIASLGQYTAAALEKFLGITVLTEIRQKQTDVPRLVKELCTCHKRITVKLREMIDHFRKELENYGICDYIGTLVLTHQQMGLKLAAQLK